MPRTTLKTIQKYLKGIDYCHFTTINSRGSATSRPMSNNGDVDYDGTSYFFTYAKSKKIAAIKRNPNVSLEFTNIGLLKKNVFVSIEGKAQLSTDKDELQEHWVPSLNLWFPDGLDTKGITLVKVKAKAIRFWAGMDSGEFKPS